MVTFSKSPIAARQLFKSTGILKQEKKSMNEIIKRKRDSRTIVCVQKANKPKIIIHQNTLKNKNKINNTNIRVMCWRFIIFMVCHLPVVKKNFETKVARAKNVVRILNATQINSCSRWHLKVSYIKTNTKFNISSQR